MTILSVVLCCGVLLLFTRRLFGSLVAFSFAGCVTSIQDGQVVGIDVQNESLLFQGFSDGPADVIQIQVRQGVEDGWTVLPDPIFPMNYAVYDSYGSPAYLQEGELALGSQWTPGGLLRLRALNLTTGKYMTMLDDPGQTISDFMNGDDFGTLFANHSIGFEAIMADASVFPEPTPNQYENRWLNWYDSPPYGASSTAYYESVDAAPGDERFTYWGWLTANGFASGQQPSGPGNWPPSPGFYDFDARAVYVNAGDLALGRDTRCRKIMAKDPGEQCEGSRAQDFPMRIACMVKNTNNGFQFHEIPDPVLQGLLNQSAAGDGTGTVVMMEKLLHDPNNSGFDCNNPPGPPQHDDVRFYVYDAGDNNLAEVIELDIDGFQAVPQVCVSCHGGDVVEGRSVHVDGARFIPFDVASFAFSDQWAIADDPDGDFTTLDDQQDDFLALNALVYETEPGAAAKEVIETWYGTDMDNPNSVALTDKVPPGWNSHKDLYRNVVAPYCRSCHGALSTNGTTPSWSTYEEFAGDSPFIKYLVCDTQVMPHAEVTQKRFFDSGARAMLMHELGWEGDCSPQ
jgi:hypothetical protein